jgi:hypothetical protein
MAPDEWTEMDVEDLKAAINDGLSVEEAAEILDRADRIDEVIKKCRELGLNQRRAHCELPSSLHWPPCRGHRTDRR